MSPERFNHYKVNDAAIDAEHFDLLSQMAIVIRHAKSGNTTDAYQLLDTLRVDLKTHFHNEKLHMARTGYKFIDGHIHSHNMMAGQIDKLLFNLTRNTYLLIGTISELESIFIEHIDRDDLQYSDPSNCTIL